MADEWDWLAYYDAVQGKPPRKTLLKALDLFDKQPLPPTARLAIDLGCGSGRDTFELLRRNWQVYAIDSSQTAISYLLNHSDLSFNLLKTQITRFEDLTLPSPTDLVNASFSLPFYSPKYFPDFGIKLQPHYVLVVLNVVNYLAIVILGLQIIQ